MAASPACWKGLGSKWDVRTHTQTDTFTHRNTSKYVGATIASLSCTINILFRRVKQGGLVANKILGAKSTATIITAGTVARAPSPTGKQERAYLDYRGRSAVGYRKTNEPCRKAPPPLLCGSTSINRLCGDVTEIISPSAPQQERHPHGQSKGTQTNARTTAEYVSVVRSFTEEPCGNSTASQELVL